MRRLRGLSMLVGLVVISACAPAAVVSKGPVEAQEIAMTFDVAYDVRYTAAFLDVLKAFAVPATIFVTGEWADTNPDLVGRMAAEGHLVANHSYSHPDFRTISDAEVADQLARADAAISSRTGRSTKPYFRPPYGAQDAA